jgi:lycopene beta-cyclase
MSETYDLVILGGGCAGLSLAMALDAQDRPCPRTLIIESRAEYTNDRTWCFWNGQFANTAYQSQHQWQTMQVSNAGKSVSLDCGLTPYQMVAAQDFYAAAQASISRQPNIALSLSTSVLGEPGHSNGLWHIRTSAGIMTARSVVDTRPPRLPQLDGATLWQSFYGQEIECNRGIFDPMSLDLMNFLAPDVRDVGFVYVLPVSQTRALVEVTVFGATPLGPAELSARLSTALDERVGDAAFTTLRTEHGILPMGLSETPSQTDASYVKVGVMAGGARPSTGYAFQRIQRWADECAKALQSSGQPVGHRLDPFALRVMDQIFLNVLRADPLRGGAIFFALFSKADPARVIRFLSGRAGVIDSLAVVAAMPVFPFLKVALAMALGRSRPREVQNAV